MNYATIFRILGVFLMLFSISMLPPVAVSIWYGDGDGLPFVWSFCATLVTGFSLWFLNYHSTKDMKIRDGFIVVTLFWVVLSAFAALPLKLSMHPNLALTDAVFEAVSGLTTTGATVLTNIDLLPHAILYYRQQLHFLGGMGVVVLAIAILPMLGIGGLQLYQAEIPGPAKDTKLTPRIAETAKALWYIYFGLMVLCALSYWVAGMPLFNAIGESFSTISTGGFAMHDDSFGYYNSITINYIAVVFMFLAGTNFTLHFAALQRGQLKVFWLDEEFRSYCQIILIGSFVVVGMLFLYGTYQQPHIAFNKGIFNSVSVATTTGLTVAKFQLWPSFIPLLFMVLGIIGGCASSTSGGIKVVRLLLMFRQGIREVRRLIHPRAIIPVKLEGRNVSDTLIQAIWGFIAAFILLFVFFALLLAAQGMNAETSLGALVACLANVGVGLGEVTDGFGNITPTCKWILTFAMILGRLEIFTVLVLFMPDFWRR